MKKAFLLIICVIFLTSCSKAPLYNENGTVKQAQFINFNQNQTEMAINELINSLISTNLLKQSSRNRNVVAIDDVLNLTNSQIDTDYFTKKVRTSMLNSGKVVVTKVLDESYQSSKSSIYSPNFILNSKIQNNNGDFLLQLSLMNPKNGNILWKDEKVLVKG